MALTRTVDGKALPAGKFAYVGDPEDISTWHLPIDEDHIDSALKMFSHERHVPQGKMKATARKIASAAREHGVDADRIKDFEDKHAKDSSEHADFNNGWVEIFRAGTYKPQSGWNGTAAPSDLQRVAGTYDPEFHEAPACIGHPKSDLPAYGWVDRMKVDDGTLLAKFKEVDPAFEAAVKNGKFKKRSAAFYLDADGKIAGLRHVGFLGAQPPEVKGLKNLNFDDHGQNFTEVEFGEENSMPEDRKTVREEISAFFAELFDRKKPPAGSATFSEDDVKRIVVDATRPLTEKISKLEGDLTSQSAKFSESQATAAVKQQATNVINGLKATGRWIPAFDKQGVPLLFEELAKDNAAIEFGEGDQKQKLTPLQLLVKFAESFGPIVPGGRVHAPSATSGARKGTGDALTDMAKARAEEKKITFAEAAVQIAEEHPELAVAGGVQAGAV